MSPAYLWGLGANGQAGVENVLDIPRNGLDPTVLNMGKAAVHGPGRGGLTAQGKCTLEAMVVAGHDRLPTRARRDE